MVLRDCVMLTLAALQATSQQSELTTEIGQLSNDARSNNVVGGIPVERLAYPWVVLMWDLDRQYYFCCATLISDWFILTAAHCMTYNNGTMRSPDMIRFEIGRHNRTVPLEEEEDALAIVGKAVSIHPNFNEPTFRNDVAIIELAEQSSYDGVQFGDAKPITGDYVFVVGWGYVNNNHNNLAEVPQQGDMEVVDCREGIYSVSIDQIICASGENADSYVDACIGDSGAPLLAVENGTPRLVGIVSFGPSSCGQGPNHPGVYQDVAQTNRDFIDSVIGDSVGGTTSSPSAVHTVSPTTSPTVSPTTSPSASPSGPPSQECNCSSSSCTDLDLPVSRGSRGSVHVCSMSKLPGGGCSGKVKFTEANTLCTEPGMRLCSLQELVDDETAGSGCDYDSSRVWSSTPCPNSGEYWTTRGKKGGSTFPSCQTSDSRHKVRCCADVDPNDCCPPPQDPPCTNKSCESLGITKSDKYGSPDICASTKINGACPARLNHNAAASFCSAGQMRVCALDEVLYDEARDTGCTLDSKRLWTSTPCRTEGEFCTARGQAKGNSKVRPRCDIETKLYYVRCCANTEQSLANKPCEHPIESSGTENKLVHGSLGEDPDESGISSIIPQSSIDASSSQSATPIDSDLAGLGPRASDTDSSTSALNSRASSSDSGPSRIDSGPSSTDSGGSGNAPGIYGNVPVTPRTSGNVPETSSNVPGTSDNVPETSSNVPGIYENVHGTSGNVPETSGNVPETSSNVPGTQ